MQNRNTDSSVQYIIRTPHWNRVLLAEKDVYEPSEDTFLLLDALQDDLSSLALQGVNSILEIGSGSGIVITALANIFGTAAYCLAIDISPNACLLTKNTAFLNNVSVDVIEGDLVSNLHPLAFFDVVIFNPPYVRTCDKETKRSGIAAAWAGGENGRKIIDRLLPELRGILSKRGIFYMVTIDYNCNSDIIAKMSSYGFQGSILKKRKIPGESLFVLKFVKE